MAEVKFIYKTQNYIIQCKKNEVFKNICQKFSNKADVNFSSAYFLYDSKLIDLQLTFEQIAKGDDKRDNRMIVLVELNEDRSYENKNITISKEIICPTCKENCLIKFKDYKIDLNCKKNHEFHNILLDKYKKYQAVDFSKIICEDCKVQNKLDVFENKFFTCISCKKNICPLCKSKHNKSHDIIDYDLKDYICFNHNEKFSSYCKNCKLNLCIECESNHQDKNNIILYRDILPEKDTIISQISELRVKIDQFKIEIDKLKYELDEIIKNYELYYLINDNLMKIYQKKNRNYQTLTNLKEISMNNNNILNDLNTFLGSDSNSLDKFVKTINIHSKMMNINANENIFVDRKLKKKNQINKIVNEKKGNNYEKFIYIAMLAEQASKYDDMAEFMKRVVSEKSDDMSSDERNLMSIAFKNVFAVNRSAIRTIIAYENKERKKENSSFLSYIMEYKKLVSDELIGQIEDIINFIEKNCLPKAKEDESKGFYLKMIGDYYRFIGEFAQGSLKNKIIDNCNKYYSEANKILSNFSYLNPIKLGLLLNTTVYYYEVMSSPQKAINLAQTIVKKFEEDRKNKKIDENSDDFKDSLSIYNLVKENLDMWKSEK